MTAKCLVSTTDKKWATASKEISIPWSRKVIVGGFSYQRFYSCHHRNRMVFFFPSSPSFSRCLMGPKQAGAESILTLSLQSSWLLDGSPNWKVFPINMHFPLVWLLTPLNPQDAASLCLLCVCLFSHGALRFLQTVLSVGEKKTSRKYTFGMLEAFR